MSHHEAFGYEECFNTLPVPRADAESPLRCRYVYGYGVDGSDRPATYSGSIEVRWPLLADRVKDRGLLRPCQSDFHCFTWVLEHFFDAFAPEHKRDIRVDAALSLELDSENILSDLVVKQDVAQQFLRKGHTGGSKRTKPTKPL